MFWREKKHSSKQDGRAKIIEHALLKPDHLWIRQNRVLQNRIVDLLAKISESDLDQIFTAEKTAITYSDGLWACTFSNRQQENVILVFPNLLKLFLSAEYPQAQAILAHELGHILCGHHKKSIPLLQAQLEADSFAKGLGLSEELAYALLDFPMNQEILSRVEKLKK